MARARRLEAAGGVEMVRCEQRCRRCSQGDDEPGDRDAAPGAKPTDEAHVPPPLC